MASGMAREHQAEIQGATTAAAAAGLLLSAWLAAALAQQPTATEPAAAAPAQEQPGTAAQPAMPAPFSRDCRVANEAFITDSPLPNVAAALQQRKTIKILAIGASPSS